VTRSVLALVLALVAAPAAAWLVYRLARELGFLDAPVSAEHEHRRTILAALYALLLLLPAFLFGYARRWPRFWLLFGIASGAALLFFGFAAVLAARRLWKLRHPALGLTEGPAGSGSGPAPRLPDRSPDPDGGGSREGSTPESP